MAVKPDPDMTDSDSESGIEEPVVKADFDLDDMEIIDLCDVDETIERFMKREPSEPLAAYRIPQSRTEPEPRIKPELESQTEPALSLVFWDAACSVPRNGGAGCG
jgi:hypothetical protein